jgi:hypothetical protein
MLDLKAKLAAAGLVSAADIAAPNASPPAPPAPRGRARQPRRSTSRQAPATSPAPQRARPKQPARPPKARPSQPVRPRQARPPQPHKAATSAKAANKPRPLLDIAALQRGNKGEAYDAIRRVVDSQRLDPAHGIPGDRPSPSTSAPPPASSPASPSSPSARASPHRRTRRPRRLHVPPRPRPLRRPPPARRGHPRHSSRYWLRVLQDHPGAGQSAPRPEAGPVQRPAATPDSAPEADP